MLDAADKSERPFFQRLYDDAVQREREAEAAARAANIADQVALLRIPEANADRFQEGLAAAVAALVRLRTLENLESRVTALEQRNQELQAEIISLKQSQLSAPRPPNPRPTAVPVSQPNTILIARASGTVMSAGSGASSSSGSADSFALVIVPNAGTSAQNATIPTGVQYSGPMVDKRAATLPSKYDGKADITSWIRLFSTAGKQAKGVEESSALPTTGEAGTSVAGPSDEPESDQQPTLEARNDAESKAATIHVLYTEPWEESKEVDFHAHMEHWLQLKQQRRVQGSVELTFFKLLINRRYIRVLIDSGSTTNFFSPNGIRKAGLGMKQVELQNPCQTQVGNQEVVTSTHAVKGVRVTFDKSRTVTHELNFYVMDKCPFDAVIGLGWLKAHCLRTTWADNQFVVRDAKGNERTVLLDEICESLVTLLSATKFCKSVRRRTKIEHVHVAFVKPIHVPSTFAAFSTSVSNSTSTTSTSNPSTSTVNNPSTSNPVIIAVNSQSDFLPPDEDDPPPEDPTNIRQLLDRFPEVLAEPRGVPERPVKHKIEIIEGSVPPKGCVYRMGQGELEELKRRIDDMIDRGWIRPSESEFGAPVLFVPKKGGKLRMRIEYRGLNRITRKNAYPLPRIDDLLDAAGGCKVFSKIDLRFGYHQIEVDPSDQHKTTFKTRDGLYEFIVMPFGLTNAPATFQCLMDKVLRHQLNRFVVVYLDDILIFSKSMEEHVKHLEEVLQVLNEAQLHLNLEKFEFGRDSVIYLGHRLSANGLELEATKVDVIREWPQPANVRELRSFLDLASYYRKFVPKFSVIAHPLSRLTSKNVAYAWCEKCETVFQDLKEAFVSHHVLRIADPILAFVVTTDASQFGIGAVLQQDDGDGLYGPGELISIDFTNIGKVSEAGNSQIMVIVDRFSKFLNLIPFPPHAPIELVIEEFHQQYILQFGVPKTIVSDRDTRFISKDWKDFTSQIYDIKLNKTSGRHPEANGLAEEINQTVIQLLRALIVPDQNTWDKELHKVKGLYNHSIHFATGVTPNQLQYGWPMRNPLSYLFPERSPGLMPGMPGYNVTYTCLLKVVIAAMNKRQHAMIKHANKLRKEEKFKGTLFQATRHFVQTNYCKAVTDEALYEIGKQTQLKFEADQMERISRFAAERGLDVPRAGAATGGEAVQRPREVGGRGRDWACHSEIASMQAVERHHAELAEELEEEYHAWLVRQAKRYILTQTGFELEGAKYLLACRQFEDFHMQQGRFAERNWAVHEGIHTKKRNRLAFEKVVQLVEITANVLLTEYRRAGCGYVLPRQRDEGMLDCQAGLEVEPVHTGTRQGMMAAKIAEQVALITCDPIGSSAPPSAAAVFERRACIFRLYPRDDDSDEEPTPEGVDDPALPIPSEIDETHEEANDAKVRTYTARRAADRAEEEMQGGDEDLWGPFGEVASTGDARADRGGASHADMSRTEAKRPTPAPAGRKTTAETEELASSLPPHGVLQRSTVVRQLRLRSPSPGVLQEEGDVAAAAQEAPAVSTAREEVPTQATVEEEVAAATPQEAVPMDHDSADTDEQLVQRFITEEVDPIVGGLTPGAAMELGVSAPTGRAGSEMGTHFDFDLSMGAPPTCGGATSTDRASSRDDAADATGTQTPIERTQAESPDTARDIMERERARLMASSNPRAQAFARALEEDRRRETGGDGVQGGVVAGEDVMEGVAAEADGYTGTTAAREVPGSGCEPPRGRARGVSTDTLEHALRVATRVVQEQTPRKRGVPPRPRPVAAERGAALGESSGAEGLGMPPGSRSEQTVAEASARVVLLRKGGGPVTIEEDDPETDAAVQEEDKDYEGEEEGAEESESGSDGDDDYDDDGPPPPPLTRASRRSAAQTSSSARGRRRSASGS
ncbi:hypothetical protein CBR_g4658 [Chara braunii]|uniref:Reverse transcriptase n=1 Tax=Chara braunii TaxID=69332 RepID=A0A388KIG4_CHABU|nr:hypothetical protein CBR_g4658 [Chara braunii]|eukprot:GBG69829.1 hypothetical protein CBR_g4658 [Chara braunii]